MQEEKKRILKMVEEGKLKVDEALLLLEQHDKSKESSGQKKDKLYSELSAMFQSEDGKKTFDSQATQQKLHSAKEKFLEFVDVAVKKIKDLDLDWNFGQSVDVSHIYQQADATIKDVDIDVANGSVRLVPWDQPEVRIDCDAKMYRVESLEEAKSVFLNDVVFAVEGEKLRFGAQQKWMKVHAVVFVPRATFHQVRVRMFNGPISVGQLSAETLKAKTANGKVALEDVTAEKVELETVHGKIQVLKSEIADCEAETVNGAIEFVGDGQKLDLQSFNGNISVDLDGEQTSVIMTKATTGHVRLALPAAWAVSAELKSNLGNFIVDLDDIQMLDHKNEVVQKHFAFKSIRPADVYTTILADTKTGSISVKKK